MKSTLILALLLTGCGFRKPQIDGFHWDGDVLYTSSGQRAASVITSPFDMDPAQACVFMAAGIGISGCSYFENGQLAYDHIGQEFAEAKRYKENQ